MMEKDPRYCDVIADRWEEWTGRSANRIGKSAVPFNEEV